MSTANPSQLAAQLRSLKKDSFKDDEERLDLVNAASELLANVRTGWEIMSELTLGNPNMLAGLKVMLDKEMFKKWQESGGGPKTTNELAAMTDTDPELLGRYLRHMAATNLLKEAGPSTYEQTPFTRLLLEPSNTAWVHMYFDWVPSFSKMPDYLKSIDYKNPTSAENTGYAFAFGEPFFAHIGSTPTVAQWFNDAMSGYAAERKSYLEVFPSDELVATATDKDAPILVDVGGGLGHDLVKFAAKHPGTADRLVLQDLEEATKKALVQPPVKIMVHDFFTPQPVKGARAYFLHSVFHDWPRDASKKILQNLKLGMKPGYSKLLVNETVVPEQNVNSHVTTIDLTMVNLLSSQERTEPMWRELFESEGFKVTKIHTAPSVIECLIEAELLPDS